MQTTENVIRVMQTLSKKGEPLTRVYRQLYNPNLYLSVYNHLNANMGSLTPGATVETIDGTSLTKIYQIISALQQETYRWTPVRRQYVARKDGIMRPLGLPTWSDKLVEGVIKILLEAYYEPIFNPHSHGYRPGRGCHTALQDIVANWTGTVWFIEGDIHACFENIDHDLFMKILARRIQDNRLLRLIQYRLESGILEDWQYQRTYSGVPQGGVLSPLLANIYLNELDTFIEDELMPKWNIGKKRRCYSQYQTWMSRKARAAVRNDKAAVKTCLKAIRQIPSQDMFDPGFKRLKYVRYADDFLLGFIGSKAEAQAIQAEIETFLTQSLRLKFSSNKSRITHAKSEYARFLNYDIGVYGNVADKITENQRGRRRSANGRVELRLPAGMVEERCREWQRDGKPRINGLAMAYSVEEALLAYQRRYRGLVNYYQYTVDVHELARLKYAMEQSLVHTLSAKLKISVSQVYKKLRAKTVINGKSYRVLQSVVKAENGKQYTFTWGGVPLIRRYIVDVPLSDEIVRAYYSRSELVQRLLAEQCELCGRECEELEGHHVKRMANLPKQWRKGRLPQWVHIMIARRRKTLFVCPSCHVKMHTYTVSK